MGPRLTLEAGPMRLELAPGLGGAVTALTGAGVPWLRPTPADAADVLQTACFPLVPFANRIAHGRVAFGGRRATLPPNLPGDPHPLHGEGWRGAWTVERATRDHAVLAFASGAGAWPWRYVARQSFRLDPRGVTIRLEMINTDAVAAPGGLGFHPYFPHPDQARLTAQADGIWLTDAEHLPTRHVANGFLADWRRGAEVAGERLIDYCHTGWTGEARIDLGSTRLRLTASPELSYLHVYAPPGEDFFCVEPVSHRPDALNGPDPVAAGVRVLAPGETLAAEMRIERV
jgi:aldose 1-epimerase